MAAALLVTAGAGAWYSLLGGTVLRVAPLGAVVVLVAARRLSPRQGGALLALWFPAAVLAAGVPADRLLPHAWPSVLARLSTGAQRLTASQGALITNQPWPLAAWLLLIGVVWVAGTALAASNPRSARRRILGFGILTAPWIAAVLLSTVGASLTHPSGGWHGATILLAGLLWATAGRVAIRPALALGMAAALISVGVAQAAGPRGRWFSPGPQTGSALQFRTLQTEPTYGPLQGRRSGSAMLEITASQPALWRMRVLILFAGPGWRIGYPPGELPEPAGRIVETTVRVRGLRDDLLVAPGRIVAIHARATPHPAPGEAWQLTPAPDRGDAYQTQASVVHATAKQLGGAPAPTDQRLQVYTRLTPGYAWPSVGVPLFGQAPDPKVTAILDRTPYGPVAALARQLAAGASTQLDVVARVERYLRDGGRFRYTTNLPEPGLSPLADFLLRDHAGDCQHFAGAAALLLRLAGVPTRVVAGFATGEPQPDGRFEVRDVDAHAWIEVYFQGYGWVPFNPTPAAAQARVRRELDPLAPTPATGGPSGRGDAGYLADGAILGVVAAAGAAAIAGARRRRNLAQLGQLLESLVRRAGGRVQASSTLGELSVELARLVGPRTAALATHAERVRFAPDTIPSTTHPRIQVARALTGDLGPIRALRALTTGGAERLRALRRSELSRLRAAGPPPHGRRRRP